MIPNWLMVMRAITGGTEVPGDADNPRILAMADYIAHKYPEMEDYCAQYTHDSIAWCGLTVAFCMSVVNQRPVFGETDTDKFLWAQAWLDWGLPLEDPVQGCVMIFSREGGGHVTLLEQMNDDGTYTCRGGNQGDSVKESTYSEDDFLGARWPTNVAIPHTLRLPVLGYGDKGRAVKIAQKMLNKAGANPSLKVDGEFGELTDVEVRAFQGANDLVIDGVIGPRTWTALAKSII